MICNWIKSEENIWECSNCKHRRKWAKEGIPPDRNCSIDPINVDGSGPTFVQMAKNLTVAVTKHIKDGGRQVNQQQYDERIGTCEGSEEKGIPACSSFADGRCKEKNCGCIVRIKAWLRSEGCPKKKWVEL